MQFVVRGAMAGVCGCQTLGQVSEQMDSLLDRQSSQRILPNESCLQVKGESRVQCHKRVTQPGYNTQVQAHEKKNWNYASALNKHRGLLTTYEMMSLQKVYLHRLRTME